MHDRAMQTLYKWRLNQWLKQWPTLIHTGLGRKGRATMPLRNVFFPLPGMSAQWVFEADIKGCFDDIRHDWILENIPMNKTILKKWLKSGYIEEKIVPNKRERHKAVSSHQSS